MPSGLGQSNRSIEALGRPVVLLPHDPRWGDLYRAERELLREAVDGLGVEGPHHVGGTAVKGAQAEPVIDILLDAPADPRAAEDCAAALRELGYSDDPDWGDDGARRFFKGSWTERTHEVHLAVSASRGAETLAFRDFLQRNPQAALGYAGMKRDLARRHAADRGAYTRAKAEIFRAVLAGL